MSRKRRKQPRRTSATRSPEAKLEARPAAKSTPEASASGDRGFRRLTDEGGDPEAKLQRREHPRVPVKTNIGLNSGSNLYTGLTNDISEGGVFVATHQLLPIGSEVDLEVSFADVGGPELKTRAVVRWIRDEDAGEGDPGMGVCFLDLDDEQRGWVQRFVESRRQPLFYENEITASKHGSEAEEIRADLENLQSSRTFAFVLLGAAVVALALIAAFVFGAFG